MPNLNPSLVRHPPLLQLDQGSLHGGYWYGWVLLRLFPLIMPNDSPLQAFSGTDRVTRYPFQFTWFCYGVRASDFVNAPYQVHGKILAILLRPHRLSSIADQPLRESTSPTTVHHPPSSAASQNTAIAFVASHVNDTDQSNLVREPRDPHEQQSLTTPIQLYPCLDALFPAKATAQQRRSLLDLGVGVTL